MNIILTTVETPSDVESQWDLLTEWQKCEIAVARTLNKLLDVTIIELPDGRKILYDVKVCKDI